MNSKPILLLFGLVAFSAKYDCKDGAFALQKTEGDTTKQLLC